MAKRNKKNDSIVKFNTARSFNIGFVVFLVVMIYVLFHMITYFTSSNIAEYEVKQGSIATNNIYRGLVLRDETVVNCDKDGDINYFVSNASRVSVDDIIYSVDTEGSVSSQIESAVEEGSGYTTENMGKFINEIYDFSDNYSSDSFSNVYDFKQNLSSKLNQTLSQNALANLDSDMLSSVTNSSFYTYKSATPGVVYYGVDGYEGVTVDSLNNDLFEGKGYAKTELDNRSSVNAGDAAYKIVNSEKWNVVLKIDDDMAESLSEKSAVKIRFCKDNFTTNVGFTLQRVSGDYYLCLNMTNSMIRYIDERFLDIELVLGSKTGLKIPNSAITSKSFFEVPKECFFTGMDSSDLCILVQGKNGSTTSITPTIFYGTDDAYYLDSEDVSKGDVLVIPDSSNTYTVGKDIGELTGVYNINKGYAVFKQISIISQNDDYAIVEAKTSYGLSLYDHIALDGSSIKENQTIR